MDPLFPSISSTITKASNYTRLSIRCCALLIEASIEAVRYSTATSINASRNLLTSAVHNPDHLERYSSLGSYVIHHAFNLTELITMTTLNFATVTTRISSTAADELCKLVDGLFGSTETSRALAAIIELLSKELCPKNIGIVPKIALTGTITKSMLAYCLLQFNVYGKMLDDFRLTHLGFAIVDKVVQSSDDDKGILEEFDDDFAADAYMTNFENTSELKPTLEELNEDDVRTYMKRSSLDSLLKSPSIESLKQKTVPNIVNHYEIMDKFKGTMDRQLLLNIQKYITFSLAAYGKRFMRIFGVKKVPSVYGDISHPNHWAFAHKVNIQPHDIISSSFQSSSKTGSHPIHLSDTTMNSLKSNGNNTEMGPVVYYLCADHEQENIVLTLRGTMGLSDALTDFTCSYTDFKGYKVHQGMLECALKLQKIILPDVEAALEKFDGYNLVLTGHSLGGGIAGMLAILWSNVLSDKPSKYFKNTKTLISCFAFGTPCIIDHKLSLKCKELITTVVHGSDMVPTLSLGLVQDLKFMMDFLGDFDSGCSEKIISHSLGLDITDKVDESYLWTVYKGMQTAMRAEKLVAPGHVLWIRSRTISKRIPKSIPEMSLVRTEDNKGFIGNASHYATSTLSYFTNWAAHSFYPTASSSSRLMITDEKGSSYFHETEQVLISLDSVDDVLQVFGHLNFSRTMLSDHIPSAYEEAINLLVLHMLQK